MATPRLVFEDEAFLIEQADAGQVPGYLILRFKEPASSLAELSPETAQRLGPLLTRAVRAIEIVVGAERVYCLSFCEIDRRLHVHLFPRTRWLLDAYWKATASEDQPVNGPRLFEWARTAAALEAVPQAGMPSVIAATAALRAQLAGG